MRHTWVMLLLSRRGCDSRAKASDPPRRRRVGSEIEGVRELRHELALRRTTCAASTTCASAPRARRSATTTRRSAQASARSGDLEAAISSYNQALGHYDSEKIALPPDIDCAYGAALAAGKGKKEHAELGARVLHRCLLAVPVGSTLRDRALVDLATLDGRRARSAHARPHRARRRLPDALAAAPSTDKLTITVTATPPVTGKTLSEHPRQARRARHAQAGLVACWQAYNAATHKDTLAVTIGLKREVHAVGVRRREPARSRSSSIPPAALAPGPEASADACVRGVVEPAIKDLKTLRDAFTTKLTVTIK